MKNSQKTIVRDFLKRVQAQPNAVLAALKEADLLPENKQITPATLSALQTLKPEIFNGLLRKLYPEYSKANASGTNWFSVIAGAVGSGLSSLSTGLMGNNTSPLTASEQAALEIERSKAEAKASLQKTIVVVSVLGLIAVAAIIIFVMKRK
jgi:hypothetical protein